jgi:predicted enzyme related to lactoylglutathione lyase
MSDRHGSFVWFELRTPDAAAAEAFYAKVVGWTARDAGPGYKAFLAGEDAVAGMMQMADNPGGPGWVGFVGVDDTDVYADHAVRAGAAIRYGPEDIPDIGRFAAIADPQDALILLFTPLPGGAGSPVRPGKPGYIGWRELLTKDGPAAFDFYSSLFGWLKTAGHDMGPMGVYQLFTDSPGGADVGGMMTMPAGFPAPAWRYYFQVDAIDAAIVRLTGAGGTVTNGPHQVPTGDWIVEGRDPQGASFALMSGTR